MKIQAFESEMAMVGPCAVCGELVRVKEHEIIHRLEGMGGMVCAACVAKNQPEPAPEAAATDAEEEAQVVIKHNEAVAAGPCGICGTTTNPALGPQFFLGDTAHLVCEECGDQYAPELSALLRLGRAAQSYAALGAPEPGVSS